MKDGEFVIENNVLVKYNGNSEKVIIPQGVIHLTARQAMTMLGVSKSVFYRWVSSS